MSLEIENRIEKNMEHEMETGVIKGSMSINNSCIAQPKVCSIQGFLRPAPSASLRTLADHHPGGCI